MAYRRRQQQQVGRVSTTLRADVSESLNNYNHDFAPPPTAKEDSSSSSSSSSLAAKAIRASSAYNDSSLSSAYGQSALSSPRESIPVLCSPSSNKDSSTHEYTSMKNMNEPKQGFWGVLTRKAKAIIDDDNAAQPYETRGKTKFQMSDKSAKGQYQNTYNFSQSRRKTDSPSLQKGLDAIASSFNHIGGTIGNALEEGLTTVENRTADIIQETRKIQIRKKNNSSTSQNQTSTIDSLRQQPMMQTHTHTDVILYAQRIHEKWANIGKGPKLGSSLIIINKRHTSTCSRSGARHVGVNTSKTNFHVGGRSHKATEGIENEPNEQGGKMGPNSQLCGRIVGDACSRMQWSESGWSSTK